MNGLERYRTRKGMTQVELADESGVPQPDISKAEKGVKDLKGRSWASIAQALGCSVDELLSDGMGNKYGETKE